MEGDKFQKVWSYTYSMSPLLNNYKWLNPAHNKIILIIKNHIKAYSMYISKISYSRVFSEDPR